ncbi:MAG: TRAP transporter large permease subunit, partial [Clostridiales bacterium]|nr:TRAP transporter large permease subunit [Clostridiales bacterium]
MTLALIIFLVTYVLLLALPKYRAYIALASAAVFVMLGILPVENVFGSVDWNVIMMIAGTMGIVYFFIESKMPALLADIIIQKMPNVKWTIIALSLFAGIISAFVDNVATVLMVAPVALTISKKLNMSPVSSIIAISISSNLQGAATLVGDTTSILLGGYANLDFLDFFFYKGRPGMFWVVEISAVIASLVLLVVFRKDRQAVALKDRTTVTDYFPTVVLLGTIILLILASFLPDKPQITNGLICMALFVFSLIRDLIVKRNFGVVKEALKSIDYFTLCLLAGLFIVIAGITEAGVVDAIAKLFVSISGGSLFAMYSLIVWASVILSAFIDNIPYIATMLPVVTGIAEILGVNPTLLYFGLLSGATLGGNLTPIGASANITGLGILRREGYEVGTGRFMKISVPFTLAAVISGYIL